MKYSTKKGEIFNLALYDFTYQNFVNFRVKISKTNINVIVLFGSLLSFRPRRRTDVADDGRLISGKVYGHISSTYSRLLRRALKLIFP